jgi:putative flippase GtrA
MPKFVVYVIVGSLSAIIDLTALNILISLDTTQCLAVSVAFIAGFVFNVKAHALFTFASPLTSKSALKFTAVIAVNYLLTLLIIESLTALSCSLMTAKVVSLPIIAVSGFLLGRHWAFRD